MEGLSIKKKYVLLLFLVLALSFGIRIYFYEQAHTQALWYDEADYLLRANTFVYDHFNTDGLAVRKPVIMPLVWSGLLFIGGTEAFIKFFQVLISLGGVFVLYLLGKEAHSKEVGLIMASLLGMFWLHIFFSFRIMLDEAALIFTTLAMYFFWRWYKKSTKKDAVLAGLTGSLAFMTFYIPLYIPALIVAFLLITRKFSFLKDKTFWYAVGGYVVTFIPLGIWWYVVYGDPLFGINQYHGTGQIEEGYDSGILGFFRVFQSTLFLPLFSLLIIGVGKSIWEIVSSIDLIIKRQIKKLDLDLLMLMWGLLVPIALGIEVVHVEPRYMFPAFIPVFYFMTKAILFIAGLIQKALAKTDYKRGAKFAAVVLLLVFCAYFQVGYASTIIDLKSTSFEQERYAGEWLGENLEIDESFMTCNELVVFQVYSQRAGYNFGSDPEVAEGFIEDYVPKYAVLNAYVSDCAFEYLQTNTELYTPVQAFYTDAAQTQVVIIIYEINYDYLEAQEIS
jgi:4-amino-4-deoxy-L-arabinose transferase-like glycosyltransferase